MIKYFTIIFGLTLFGCDNTTFISSDGTEKLGHCDWNLTDCIHIFCPTGAVAIKNNEKVEGDSIIRCLSDNKSDAGVSQ